MGIAAEIDVVEDNADDLATDVFDALLHAHKHVTRQFTMLDNNYRHVGDVGEHRGIADAKDGRRIDQDEIEAAFHIGDEIDHALRIEQTSTVSRQETAGEEE